MVIDRMLQSYREAILRITDQHGARNVRIFGSRARGDASADSDVDILIELDPGRTLLDLIAVQQDLEDLLGCEVDVVTERAISSYIRHRIVAEAVPL